MNALKVVFFGTSSFAARILDFLLKNQVNIIAVVTRPDRPSGRHLRLSSSAVKEYCLEHHPHIPLHAPEKVSTDEEIEKLRSYQADLFVVVAYGEIIKQKLLDVPRLTCINIHGSLLPKYRGAAPIQRALFAGESETGITIIEMNAQMDAGNILAMRAIPCPLEMTYGELEPLLCALGGELALEVITQFEKGEVKGAIQNHALATNAPKILPEDEKIEWDKTALELHNQIRALSPKPGALAFIEIQGSLKRLKILRSFPRADLSGKPGEILKFSKEEWIVACKEGALQLLSVQLEGKKEMSASTFFLGYGSKIAPSQFLN